MTEQLLNQREDLFRPLDIESTFRRVFSIFRERWGVFLAINTIAMIVQYVLVLLWAAIFVAILIVPQVANNNRRMLEETNYNQNNQYFNYGDYGYDYGNYQNDISDYQYTYEDYDNFDNPYYYNSFSQPNGTTVLTAAFAVISGTVLAYLVVCVADGATIQAVSEMYVSSSPPEFWGTTRKAIGKAISLLMSCFTLMAALFLPILLCFVLFTISPATAVLGAIGLFAILFYAVYLVVVTYHMYAVIMVEDLGACQSIQRSRSISSGHFWHVLVVLVIFNALKALINAVVTTLSKTNHGSMYAGDGYAIDFNFGNPGDTVFATMIAIIFTTFGSM